MALRIRTLSLWFIIVIGLLPLLLLSWFTYERIYKSEISETKQRHLVMAESLAESLFQYQRDVKIAMKDASRELKADKVNLGLIARLRTMHITNVAILDA